jgi:hypothetical protein
VAHAGTWNPARCFLAVMVYPFSIFLRGKRPYYYVAFKNEEIGKYLPAISTGKTKEADAFKQAWAWYRGGIPRKGGPVDIKAASLRDTIRRADISPEDAKFIISDLKRRCLILSCVFSGAPDSVLLADFLIGFWDWEKSPYIYKKLSIEHSIHRNYVHGVIYDIKKYWTGFFPSVLLGELLPNYSERFIDYLSGIKKKKNEKTVFQYPQEWHYKSRFNSAALGLPQRKNRAGYYAGHCAFLKQIQGTPNPYI